MNFPCSYIFSNISLNTSLYTTNVSLKWTFILNKQYMRISNYRFIASTFNRNDDDTNFQQNSVTTVYLENVNILELNIWESVNIIIIM